MIVIAWIRDASTACCAALLVALGAGGCGLWEWTAPQPEIADAREIRRIAFGSCAHEDAEQPIWGPIAAANPDLFIFLGDNIYGDTRDMEVLRGKYAKLGAQPGYRNIKSQCRVVATWDDHDFGVNDGGSEYPMKAESKEVFMDFFEEPADSPRRTHEGIYVSYVFGPRGRRVQVILLDLRTFRTPLIHGRTPAENMGPYRPNADPRATMLGEEQWAWLERQLRVPAELRIVGSSVQFLAEFTGWEAWANFPLERRRMLDLIEATDAEGVIFISGDTHWGELARIDRRVPYPIHDLTSSGLTEVWDHVGPDDHRVGDAVQEPNFGLMTIDWEERSPKVTLELRDAGGMERLKHTLTIRDLR